MKPVILILFFLFVSVAFATPAKTVWLSGNQSLSATTPVPSVAIVNRTETTVTFSVRINGFSVQPSPDGIAIRIGGDNESQPKLGDPDISCVTVFLPFNAPVHATAQASASGIRAYTTDMLGGAVRTAHDPEVTTPVTTMSLSETPRIVVGEPGVFRDFGVLPVTIYPVRKLVNNNVEVSSEITVRVAATFSGPRLTAPIPISFNSIYETMFLGYRDFSIGRSKLWRPGTYLILKRPNTPFFDSEVNYFAFYKRLEGYNVVVRTITEVSPTADNVRQYIRDEYYSNANMIPLEYVLLLGDVDRSTAATTPEMPTYAFAAPTTEVVPTDLPFVVLDNNGFWPFALIGRMSYGSLPGFATIVNKTIRNQHFPYTNFPNGTSVTLTPQQMWRALCFAGNYASTFTPTLNTKAVAELLREHGYETKLYLCPPDPPTGTDTLNAILNSGLSLITYCGLGELQGPAYPRFPIDSLPITGSSQAIFLGIGNLLGRYSGTGTPMPNGSCFGEKWCELGTSSQPRGGPAFFGASHLHTSTRYNNVILSGYMHGWLTEGLDKLGYAALRAKVELYRSFPLPADFTLVSEYFKYYNILGDPSLQLWVGQPDSMGVVILPTSISTSTSEIRIHVVDSRTLQSLSYKVATVVVGSNTTGGRNQAVTVTDNQGIAILPLQVIANDTVTIQVRGGNYRPQSTTLYVGGVSAYAFRVDSVHYLDTNNGIPDPGETANLQVFVKNVSTAPANAQMTLSNSFRATIGTAIANGGTVNANAGTTLTFNNVRINSIADASPIPFRLFYTGGQIDFSVPIGFCFPYVTGTSVSTGNLNPGSTATVQVNVKNQGTSPIPACYVHFETWSNGLTVTNAGWNAINAIPRNDSANISLNVRVSGTIIPGQVVPMRMFMTLPIGSDTVFTPFTLTCGIRTADYPTGPDNYGYYAYEDWDTVVTTWSHPTYNWTELDPDSGATIAGTLMRLHDDSTGWIPLPFPIRFYGNTYQQHGLSISSNGWVSFDSTKRFDFYNWHLPCAQSPHALIAPNWDDLRGWDTATGSDVFLRYYYRQQDTTLIIEWARCYTRYAIETVRTPQKFEIVFYGNRRGPTGDNVFEFQYKISSNIDQANNFTTIGIMNWERTDGLELTYANTTTPGSSPMHSQKAIRFTTQPPDNFSGIGNHSIAAAPTEYSLSNAYPNPFNPDMVVSLSLPMTSEVSVKVFDRTGREVAVLARNRLTAGTYSFRWHPVNSASGVYFVNVTAGEFHAIRKVIYIR